MRKNLLKLVTLTVAISLVASVFVGCGKPASSSGTSAAGSKEVTKPEKITAFLDTTMLTKELGQDQFAAEYKKQTGIELNIIQPAHNEYYNKLNIAFASGEIPDAVEIAEENMIKYATQGALVPMDDYISKSEALKSVDKKILDSLKINGKVYGIPTGNPTAMMDYIRKDWLDAVGLKAPTNYDEFYKMLQAFKAYKPDAIPYTQFMSPQADRKALVEFTQGASLDFKKVDGKYVDGFTQPDFKAALERLRNAYKEGLIDKEIVTNQSSTCRDKFNAGKVGVFPYWSGQWNVTLEEALKKGPAGKDASILAIPALKESPYVARVPACVAITTKSKNIPGVFKYFLEYMHDGDKGQLLFEHGVEGVHWQKKDDKIVHLPKLNDPKTIIEKAYLAPSEEITPINPALGKYELDARMTNSAKVMKQNYVSDVLLPPSKAYTKASAELIALRGGIMAKVMLGNMTVEEGLEKYAKDAKALGMDQILQELNSAK